MRSELASTLPTVVHSLITRRVGLNMPWMSATAKTNWPTVMLLPPAPVASPFQATNPLPCQTTAQTTRASITLTTPENCACNTAERMPAARRWVLRSSNRRSS